MRKVSREKITTGDSNGSSVGLEVNANARFLVGKNRDTVYDGYVKTVRTVRSVDIKCGDAQAVCEDNSADLTDAAPLSAIRNAQSIEAYLGARRYFGGREYFGGTGSKFYSGVEIGFMSIQDSNDDLAARHKLSVGWQVFDGTFEGSFVDIGFGKNEIFEKDENRFRGTVRLNSPSFGKLFTLFEAKSEFFIESEVDADLGSGSDSIQTRIGFFVPIGKNTD